MSQITEITTNMTKKMEIRSMKVTTTKSRRVRAMPLIQPMCKTKLGTLKDRLLQMHVKNLQKVKLQSPNKRENSKK
jgi:hypothetical protein